MAFVGPDDPMSGWTGPGYIGIVNTPGNPRLFAGAPCRDSIKNRWIKILGRRVEEGVNGWEPINKWILTEHIDSLNPLWQYAAYNWQVMDLIYDHLIEQNPYTHEYVPWAVVQMPIVEEWTGPGGEIGMTMEFELRNDLVWHDGTPVTAEDCVFALNLSKNQLAPTYYSICQPIDHIEQTGPYSFKVYSKQRHIFAFMGISIVALLCPKHIWEPFIAGPDGQLWTDDDKHHVEWTGWDEQYVEDPQYPGRYLTKLIGCGPFIYHDGNWAPGVSVHLEANKQYFAGRICPGDVDLNQLVDLADVYEVLASQGQYPAPNYDPKADIAPPAQTIDLDDIYTVMNHFGHTWGPGYPPCDG